MGVELIRANTCCFTGHRHIPLQDIPWLRRQVRQTVFRLFHKGIDIFLSGGAIGFDTLAAQEILQLRAGQLPDVKLVLALPCLGQERKWSPQQQACYSRLIAQADEAIYTGDLYEKGCYFHRDRYMVDRSVWCVAYLLPKQQRGGTLYTVQYAQRQGLSIVNLAQAPQATDLYQPDPSFDPEPDPSYEAYS